MKKLITTLLLLIFAISGAVAQKGFAIVIDPQSYKAARTEVEAYAKAIEEEQHLKVYTIIDRWSVPDSIRQQLYKMYLQKKNPIEGAVFIGDIPIAMIRDAQHMTSAFKMDQQRDRKRSSVPSDRYYDDFDLKFDFLDSDKDVPYFYYSLRADSPQRLDADIYTGRIRPTDSEGLSRYEKLRRYLRKVVLEKRQCRPLKQMFYFGGHGYISESTVARIDEKQNYYEHFPWMRRPQKDIGFMEHSQDKFIKYRLMNELMRDDLELAVLHHHGRWDTEYLSAYQKPPTPFEAKAYIQNYCRSKLRTAKSWGKDVSKRKAELMAMFDIPSHWIDNAFNDSVVYVDSLTDAKYDLHVADFKTYKFEPQARLVIIDACFCGSFHRSDCIANAYIFSSGRTIACMANSVNVLQDKWPDRYLGLVGLGMNVGELSRFAGYLESHIIGDPTYRFVSAEKHIDVQKMLRRKPIAWKKQLKSPFPDLQCMAMRQLVSAGKMSSNDLLHIFRSSVYAMVRCEALYWLAEKNDDNFLTAIACACDDSNELVQRLGVRFLGKTGSRKLVPALMQLAIGNNTSARTNFNVMADMSYYPEKVLMAEFKRQFSNPNLRFINKDEVATTIATAIHLKAERSSTNCDKFVAGQLTAKQTKFMLRSMRNICPYDKIPLLLDYLDSCDDETAVCLLETLGWQRLSYQNAAIRKKALQVSNDKTRTLKVRNEALKTYNRMK